MQGYFIVTRYNPEVAHAVCKNCIDTENFTLQHGCDTVFIGEDFAGTVTCSVCDAQIDGEFVEPKPQSFTVTVEVIVYADNIDIETAADASEYVVDILDGYFEHAEATDVKEHF